MNQDTVSSSKSVPMGTKKALILRTSLAASNMPIYSKSLAASRKEREERKNERKRRKNGRKEEREGRKELWEAFDPLHILGEIQSKS